MNNDTTTPPASVAEPFGKVIYAYTRKQALADGVQVDISRLASSLGYKVPVFITATVFDKYVKIPAGVEGEGRDEADFLCDMLWKLHCESRRSPLEAEVYCFRYYFGNPETEKKVSVILFAAWGALDMDDPTRAITIMMPNED